jgi:hypothetical protein
MTNRTFAVPALIAAICLLAPIASAEDSGWTLPRTPWGHPDLQGMWTNETITPFERPVEQEGKTVLSEEEATSIEDSVAKRRAASDGTSPPGTVGGYNQVWLDSGDRFLSSRQTSLVVDPPNGRVPTRASAEARRDYNRAHQGDSYVHMSVWDRCISRGVPGSMFPAGYNNAYRILQTPDHVAILYEMIHDARIIPLDGEAHVGDEIRLWMGDSRGRWEGDTLVVETTNIQRTEGEPGVQGADEFEIRASNGRTDDTIRIVERFTRVSDDTINYHFTVEDPSRWTTSYSGEFPFVITDGSLYEYACHEGNYSMANILAGERALEAAGRRSR